MTAGETILKFTDYPFAYSLVFIAAGIVGFGLNQNKFYLLGIAGALGTLLTIVDPIGRFVRKQLKNSKRRSKIDAKYFDYQESAIHSRAIGIEVDRIGGMLYFTFTTLVFFIGMLLPSPTLAENFVIYDKNNQTLCDTTCIRAYSLGGCTVVFAILSSVARRKWSELDDKVAIARMHQFAIGNENATVNSVENLTRSIDLGDWSSAEKWNKKIEDEIKFKKGKREIIIKSAETVFRPLHAESISMMPLYHNAPSKREYDAFPTTAWDQIKKESTHVMVQDNELRKEIEEFYQKIKEYNDLRGKLIIRITEYIKICGTGVFARKVSDVRYFVEDKFGRHSAPTLLNCLLFHIHPLKTENELKPHQLDVNYTKDGDGKTLVLKPDQPEFADFEKFWSKVTEMTESDSDVHLLRRLHQEIGNKNTELLQKYVEQIDLQWKV